MSVLTRQSDRVRSFVCGSSGVRWAGRACSVRAACSSVILFLDYVGQAQSQRVVVARPCGRIDRGGESRRWTGSSNDVRSRVLPDPIRYCATLLVGPRRSRSG